MDTCYPKIDTLFERDKATFKVQSGVYKNRAYSLLKTWRWTEKIDGTNVRVIFSPVVPNASAEDVLINGAGAFVRIGGRTDNAQMPVDLVTEVQTLITTEKMSAIFQSPVVLYGEGYGGSIQKGSGYSVKKKFILFDVLVDGQWWMNDEQVRDIASKLGVDVVPLIGTFPIEEAAEYVKEGFPSLIAEQPGKMAEGFVGRPLETLFDSRGHRLITKLKTKDF